MSSPDRTQLSSIWPYTGQLVLFGVLFLGALANVALLSLGIGLSSKSTTGLTWRHIEELLTNARVATALLNSLTLAATTAVISVPLGFLCARYVLALRSPALRLIVSGVILIPLLSSSVLRMLGFSVILSDSGPFTRLLCWNASVLDCSGLLFSRFAIVVGVVSNLLPICVLIFFVQLLRIPIDEILAAKNLGADAWQTVWRVEIPRCSTAFVVAAQLCALFVLGDTLATSILGGNSIYTYTTAISDRMRIDAWADAAALASLLVVISCFVLAAIIWKMQGSMLAEVRR